MKGWNCDDSIEQPESSRLGVEWFAAKLSKTLEEVDDLMGKYRISEALMAVYKLFWDEFSSWYLEVVKPEFGKPMDKKTYDATTGFFDALLRMLHPFMPFITEELWQQLEERREGQSIMYAEMPVPTATDGDIIARFETLKEIVGGVRNIRKKRQIPNREPLKLETKGEHDATLDSILIKMGNLESISEIVEKDPMAASFIVGATEYNIPLESNINVDEEIAKLEADLKYQEGFLETVNKKLNNERFVANAPEKVVALEKKKRSDAEQKIAAIRSSLEALRK